MIEDSEQIFLYLNVLTWGRRGLAYRCGRYPQHVLLVWREFTRQDAMLWGDFEAAVDRVLYGQATVTLGRLEIKSDGRRVMIRAGERRFWYPKHQLDTWRMSLHPSMVVCLEDLDLGLARYHERVHVLRLTPQRAVKLHDDAVALLKYIEGREGWWNVEGVKRIGVTYGDDLIVIETLAGSMCVDAPWGTWTLPARLIQQLPQAGEVDLDRITLDI